MGVFFSQTLEPQIEVLGGRKKRCVASARTHLFPKAIGHNELAWVGVGGLGVDGGVGGVGGGGVGGGVGVGVGVGIDVGVDVGVCLLYTSPSPRDRG